MNKGQPVGFLSGELDVKPRNIYVFLILTNKVLFCLVTPFVMPGEKLTTFGKNIRKNKSYYKKNTLVRKKKLISF